MIYKVRLQKIEEGFSVSCPGLPGCSSQGKTEDEALANIKDAIQQHLAAMGESMKHVKVRVVEVTV